MNLNAFLFQPPQRGLNPSQGQLPLRIAVMARQGGWTVMGLNPSQGQLPLRIRPR